MTWWHYLLLVNIYLLLFYGFYVLLLRKETFFQLNRVYLVAASLLSFFIPVIQSNWVKNLFITQEVQTTIYNSPVMLYQFKPIIQNTQITIGEILALVYLAGMVFLMGRLTLQLIQLKRIMEQPESTEAFAFFNKIKLGEEHAGNAIIAEHEQVHASQWHSADVLLIEAVMIINWFNPVVYLYRFAIKRIHEFIADRQAIKSGTDKSDYALLLLSQTFNAPAHQLVNPFFNHSMLKQRIMMINKNKSHMSALVKYGLSAPLFVLMLVLSSATVNNSKTINFFNKKAEQVFLTPATIDSDLTAKVKPAPVKDTVITFAPPKLTGKVTNVKIISPPAVTDTVPAKDDRLFTAVEQVPQFPGGINAFGTFLSKNMHYPASSRKNGVQGRVIITFVIEKSGELTGIKVVRSVDKDIDNEALRVMHLSPNWQPGIQNGKLVRVAYTVPIGFMLDDAPGKQWDEKGAGEITEKRDAYEDHSKTLAAVVRQQDTTKTNRLAINGLPFTPLYMIDGKQVESLDEINPDDIESISVLKDKASTALYGPKGMGGVVLVTTKKKPLLLKKTKPAGSY
ncbi:TonB family protein [Mucilaginibacter sp.]|uniref:TonB family protein n=1 Tax=Mucilaginibacter sp. TaxID=1882438 RepID=UPI003D13FE74